MKYFCWIKGRSCEFANPRGWCEISACIKRGEQNDKWRGENKNQKNPNGRD